MPWPACTCTQVTADCQKILNLKRCLQFKAPFNRPNLFYEVRAKPDSNDECVAGIVDMLTSEFRDCTGIIYSLTIKDVETLAEKLNASGLRVAPYHGNLGKVGVPFFYVNSLAPCVAKYSPFSGRGGARAVSTVYHDS